MKFTKMHGIGNDYVYVNGWEETVEDPSRVAVRISDRHKGIGSDGLILILPSEIADCRMEIYNADGSRGLMCGNGIRCVGKYVYDHGIARKPRVTVESASGVKELELIVNDGKVSEAVVDMGVPILTSNGVQIPLAGLSPKELEEHPVWEELKVEDQLYRVIGISMGNPHVVTWLEDCDLTDLELEKIGPKFECHPRFPDRTNTEFVQVVDSTHLKMRVWERGSGETMACGTGACAVMTASCLAGFTGRQAEVSLRGGNLRITWREDGHILMQGPAVEVFHGEIALDS